MIIKICAFAYDSDIIRVNQLASLREIEILLIKGQGEKFVFLSP